MARRRGVQEQKNICQINGHSAVVNVLWAININEQCTSHI